MNTMMDKPMFRFILKCLQLRSRDFQSLTHPSSVILGGMKRFDTPPPSLGVSIPITQQNIHNSTITYFTPIIPRKKKQFLSDMHHVFWSNYFQICCLAHIFPLWHSFSACLCLSSLVFFSLGPWFTQDISLSLRVFVNGKAHVNTITQLCWITQT